MKQSLEKEKESNPQLDVDAELFPENPRQLKDGIELNNETLDVTNHDDSTKELKNAFEKVERLTRMEEMIRLKGHTYLTSAFITFNVLLLLPVAFLYWFTSLMGINLFQWIDNMNWLLFICFWIFPLFTWYYSTITIPIKDGFKVLVDWSDTKKARWKSALFNLSVFHVMSWAAVSKYITNYYFEYLNSVRVPDSYMGILLVDDLDSFLLLLYFIPVILSGFMVFLQWRDYKVHKDMLAPYFLSWEAPLLTRLTHTVEMNQCDVIVGYDAKTKKPLVIKEDLRYIHQGVWGPTGSGKTSTSILLQIVQDLIRIATGRRKMGLVFLEPKGDGVDDVLKLCKKLGIPDEKIMVIDPTKDISIKYNPFVGPIDAAATSFQGTLNALSGDQDEFFKGQQNEAAQMYTLLAKIRYGNVTNITHLQQMFSDPRYLADVVEQVNRSIAKKRAEGNLTTTTSQLLDNWEAIVNYFENDVLEFATYRDKDEIKPVIYAQDHRYAGKQMVKNKKDSFVTGAKKYLNEIALNSLLSTLFISKEGDKVFDADKFLSEGGVLLVNTALAELEELSLMFGQFFIRQFQSAVFRREKEDNEKNIERIPIYLYVDEFPLYVNEAFERLLTLGRSYKVGTLIAMQSLGQLDNIVKGFKETVLSNASHKTVFGRGTVADNKYFSEEFGEKLIMEESLNESASPMTTDQSSWGFRMNSQKKLVPRFTPTDIKELPFKHMIVQIVDENNSIDIATKAVGKFVGEAKFLKRYLKINASELKSTKEKEFVLEQVLGEKAYEQLSSIGMTFKQDEIQPIDVYNIESIDASVIEQYEINKQKEPTVLKQEEAAPVDNKVKVPVKTNKKSKIDKMSTSGIQQQIDFGTEVTIKEVELRLSNKPIPTEKKDSSPNEVSVPPEEVNDFIQQIVHASSELSNEQNPELQYYDNVAELAPPEEDPIQENGGDIDFNKLFSSGETSPINVTTSDDSYNDPLVMDFYTNDEQITSDSAPIDANAELKENKDSIPAVLHDDF